MWEDELRLHSIPIVCGAIAILSACAAEPPYLLTNYRAHSMGYVKICYSTDNATPEQVRDLAEEVCNQVQRTALLRLQQTGQCSWTAPTIATFTCEARPGETPPPLVRRSSPMQRNDTNVY